MRSISCYLRKLETTSPPKIKLTPLSFSAHPAMPFYGSAHNKSQSNPWSGTSSGLTNLRICSKLSSWGLKPPCIHSIFSSISAQTGMTLNTSEKVFHSLILYFLLPWLICKYISRKSRISCWCWSIRGCLWAWRSSQGSWSCKQAWGRWSRLTVFLGQHNLPKTNSWSLQEIQRIRRV